jgi:2,4-diaminopentanoate dehydrogenase
LNDANAKLAGQIQRFGRVRSPGFGLPRLQNSFMVRVSPDVKMRGVRLRRGRTTEIPVKKKIRAIQYGVGPIGASIARLMREKQAIEICGAIDTDPAKIGRDLGEVVGAADAPWGVKISGDAREVLEQSADIVIHSTSSSLPKVMDQLLACLEAEACIVSTCEELSYPYRTYPELSMKLDAAAKDWGVALVGTGVNPGFVMDKLVVTLAGVAQRIEHAKALRIVDASKRRLPLQKKIGAGMTVDEFRAQVAAGVIKHVGLPESVAMVADSLNLPVEEITETIEPVVARERVLTEFVTVEAGQAAGVHQIARGVAGGKELVYLELQMYVGAKDPADTVELKGHPNISLVIPGGSHGDIATASVVVNSIPVILDAPAGLRTSRDLPIGFFSPNARP